MSNSHRAFAQILGAIVLLVAACHAADAESRFSTPEAAAAAKKDPNVTAALAAMDAQSAALVAQDRTAWAASLAPDLVVNAPSNRVARRSDVTAFFDADRIRYSSIERVLDLAESRENVVIFMGTEATTPIGDTRGAGRTLVRRFTDVWRKDPDGTWRLIIRQATDIAVK